MNDTVKREAVQEMVDRIAAEHPYRQIGNRESYSPYNEAWTDAINRVDAELNSLPPAQPEVVRCRDCKHYKTHIDCVGGKYNGCDVWLNDGNEIPCKENDFCSKAVRREP